MWQEEQNREENKFKKEKVRQEGCWHNKAGAIKALNQGGIAEMEMKE